MRSGDHKLASSFLNRKRWSVADRGGERFNPALAGCCPPTPTPRYLLHLHLHLHLWPRTNPSIDRTHFSLPVPALPSIPLSRQPSSLHSFVPLSFSSLSIINPSIASSNPHLKYLSISTSTYRLRIRQHHHHHHRHHLWRRTFRHTNTSSKTPDERDLRPSSCPGEISVPSRYRPSATIIPPQHSSMTIAIQQMNSTYQIISITL